MSDSSQTPQSEKPVETLSIPQLANKLKGTLQSEDRLDQKFRLKQEAYDASHKRWRITILFVFTLLGIGVVVYFCLHVLLDPESSPDNKKWASTYMATIIAGLVGFVTGKAIV